MYVKEDFSNIVSGNEYLTASFWRVITNLGVPSFVMLSGAFLINPKNGDFKYFYKKTFKKIILPTMIFSVLYVIWHYLEMFAANAMGISVSGKDDNYWLPVLNFIKGQPNVTMWYMFMIIGLYAFTPIIIIVKDKISPKSYKIWACAMMIYGVLVNYTCSLSWILQFVPWIGYFMLGDVIRESVSKKKNIGGGGIWTITAIAISYAALILHWYLFTYKDGEINVPSSFSGVVIFATILQFVGITFMTVKKNNPVIDVISNYSFLIYLIHPFLCEVLMQFFGRIIKSFPPANFILFYTLIIIVFCIIIAKCITVISRKATTR